MDPDEALRRLRVACATYLAIDDAAEEREHLASEIVELFEGLDHWIAGGGFLPAAWSRDREGGR